MRLSTTIVSMLLAAVLAPASVRAFVGAPITHGPDRAFVGAGPEQAVAPTAALGKRNAKLVPSAWCGTETSADDQADEFDNEPFRYHAVYMLAADSPDRFDHV